MRVNAIFVFSAVLCWCNLVVAADRAKPAPCLHYQHEPDFIVNGQSTVPKEVTLSGELIERTYWGPPNWGEQPATDRLEEAWILVLDAPACVMADHANQNNDQAEFNVIVMQLVVTDAGPGNENLKQVENLVGRRVTVVGALGHAVTGHNRTPVMLMVASIASS
jgi:Domain of unknown function (DUF4431)